MHSELPGCVLSFLGRNLVLVVDATAVHLLLLRAELLLAWNNLALADGPRVHGVLNSTLHCPLPRLGVVFKNSIIIPTVLLSKTSFVFYSSVRVSMSSATSVDLGGRPFRSVHLLLDPVVNNIIVLLVPDVATDSTALAPVSALHLLLNCSLS